MVIARSLTNTASKSLRDRATEPRARFCSLLLLISQPRASHVRRDISDLDKMM
jgi:hypothetical protein